MAWEIGSTKQFSQEIKKSKRNGQFLDALDSKIQRLKENPESTGGYLSGKLHGYKSTRIIGKFRLIFKIVEAEHIVYLVAIDHRKYDYDFDADSFEA
jgi:addiction module RelE/StbE family toxin